MKYTLLLFCTIFHLFAFAQHPPEVKIIQAEYIFDQAPFEACHASTLVELKDGEIMAAWFGGKHEGNKDVSIWTAISKRGKWSAPSQVADGIVNDTLRYPCWNPVLFKAKDGILYLHYKIGPNPREWWAVYKISKNNGKTWSAAQKLPQDFLGPIKNKPIQIANGNILYPSSTESLDEKVWKVHLEQTDSKGHNWKKIAINCDTFGVIQPSILTYPDGKLQILCRSRQNVIVESWSKDKGKSWSKLKATSLPNPNSGSDAVTLQDGRQLLIYNPLSAGKNWWEGRSVLKLAISTDGKSWKDIYTFENHESGEYSYPAIIQGSDGVVYLSYTALRRKIKFFKLDLN